MKNIRKKFLLLGLMVSGFIQSAGVSGLFTRIFVGGDINTNNPELIRLKDEYLSKVELSQTSRENSELGDECGVTAKILTQNQNKLSSILTQNTRRTSTADDVVFNTRNGVVDRNFENNFILYGPVFNEWSSENLNVPDNITINLSDLTTKPLIPSYVTAGVFGVALGTAITKGATVLPEFFPKQNMALVIYGGILGAVLAYDGLNNLRGHNQKSNMKKLQQFLSKLDTTNTQPQTERNPLA